MNMKEKVINLIKKKIPNSTVLVENLNGDDHLQVTVISSRFDGLSLVTTSASIFCIKGRISF